MNVIINPGKKQSLGSRRIPSGKKIMVKGKMQVKNKNEKCTYCNKPGTIYRETLDDWLCTDRAWDCEGFKKQISDKLLEAQNRKEVKEKKSIAMLKLHNEDCEPCKVFQDNYKKGRSIFKQNAYKRYYDSLIKLGYLKEEIPSDYNERRNMIVRCRWQLRERKRAMSNFRSKNVVATWRAQGNLTIN